MRFILLFSIICACGGTVVGAPDGGDAGKSDSVDGTAGDGGWTACSSPSGQKVCDGPSQCGHDNCACPVVGPDSPNAVHACVDSPGYGEGFGCPYASDGLICVAPEDARPELFDDAEFDMGVLFADNGAADRVRYADFGLWTGAPLPIPPNCPMLAVAQICGGNCGGCGPNYICHGRSPLHPWGFCLSDTGTDTCNIAKGISCAQPGNLCFAFAVEPAAQDLANKNSLCIPADVCQDLAANLPGGAVCQ